MQNPGNSVHGNSNSRDGHVPDVCEGLNGESLCPFSQFVDPDNNLAGTAIVGAWVSEDDGTTELLGHCIKTKDNKSLKNLLRNSHWLANHPVRSNLWQQLCRYLLKAEGSIYEEFEKELFSNRKFDVIS